MSEPTDDQIITRMRSALDELTTGVDTHDEPVIGARSAAPVPRRRGAWLGAAAVTVLLAGAAVWALSTRTEDPVASSEPTAASTSAPPVPTAASRPQATTSSAPATAPGAPSLTITSARLAPGPRSSNDMESTGGGPLFLSWRIDGEDLDGFLFAAVDALSPLVDGVTVTELDPPTGSADLLGLPADGAPVTPLTIRWRQADGTVWMFQQQGLAESQATDQWIELVFAAVPGSGLPIVIPDERASLVSFGGVSTTVVTQAFTSVDTGTADLTVTNGGAALSTLVGASEVREVQIAGMRGWLGRFPDGHVEVVWEAAPGWWGLLGISPDLADQVDDIVASVVRTDDAVTATSAATPEPDQL